MSSNCPGATCVWSCGNPSRAPVGTRAKVRVPVAEGLTAVTSPTPNPATARDQAERLGALGRVPREVFALLADSKTPLKAYELLWRLQAKNGRRAPPTTLYLALATLLEGGL